MTTKKRGTLSQYAKRTPMKASNAEIGYYANQGLYPNGLNETDMQRVLSVNPKAVVDQSIFGDNPVPTEYDRKIQRFINPPSVVSAVSKLGQGIENFERNSGKSLDKFRNDFLYGTSPSIDNMRNAINQFDEEGTKKIEEFRNNALKNRPGVFKAMGGNVGYGNGNIVKGEQTPFQQYVADYPASLYDDSKSSAVDTVPSNNFDPRFTNGKLAPRSQPLWDKSISEDMTSREENDMNQGADLEYAYWKTYNNQKGKQGFFAKPIDMSYVSDSTANMMRGKRAAPRYNPLGKKMGGAVARLKKK